MVKADAITLITETAHGVFVTSTTTTVTIPCTVRSVTMNEAYKARANGLNPEYVFVLDHYFEYDGQEFMTYNSVKYKVIRTYVSGEKIELTVERVV